MHRTPRRILLIAAAFALLVVPAAAIASAGFTDVAHDNVFVADIQWMRDNAITAGCNPPANDRYCPGNNVTREQMSAFMHRLAANQVVDARTAISADSAADADELDGMDSTAFLDKAQYDSDANGVVDSTEVKIRYARESATIDMGVNPADRVICVTAPMMFERMTTVVGSGGLNLDPLGTSAGSNVYGYIEYSGNDGSTWTRLNGVGIEDSPSDGAYAAAMPIDAVNRLAAGSYKFAVVPWGGDYLAGNDYGANCELTITAYVGQGPETDVVLVPQVMTAGSKDVGS